MIVIREETFTTLYELKTREDYKKPLPLPVLKNILFQYYQGCFLNGTINEKNVLTFHHIEPLRTPLVSPKDLNTLENGSLLGRLEHNIYNLFEQKDIKSAKMLKEFFLYFKETLDYEEQERIRQYVDKRVYELGFEIKEENHIYRLTKQKRIKKGS